MADSAFRYHQPGPGSFFAHHHNRNQNRTSPPHGSRRPFNIDTPSPSRSPANPPASQNPAMYGHNGYQSQQGMLNGQNHQRFGNIHMPKHQQNHYAHHGQLGQHHGQHHHGGHIGHQHNISAGGFPNAGSHLGNYAQDHLQNGHGEALMHDDTEDFDNEYWREQKAHYEEARELSGPNQRAKMVAHQAKGVSYIPIGAAADDIQTDSRGRLHGSQGSHSKQTWDELDLGGQGLHAVSPILFDAYRFVKRLDLNFNNLTYLPPAIGQLKSLEHLDISHNSLTELPPEIGMLTNLTHLFLFENRIQTLCYELGFLYKLEVLGVLGNPLEDGQKDKITEGGTKALISHLRESMPEPPPPNDRVWHKLDESTADDSETVRALSYNILCERYATTQTYGYVPERVLSWAYRKTLIFDEIKDQNADIVCLQELDKASYDDFFRGKLAECGYNGYFAQKSRAETLGDNAKFVDGCGTFWKDKKYVKLATEHLVLGRKAVERPGAKASADMLNRVWQRDDIATVIFLENRQTGARLIVLNAHIVWNPLFKDVKLIQAAVMMEELSKLAEKYAKMGPTQNKQAFRYADAEDEVEPAPELAPSMEYSSPTQIPLLICGDFNSAAGSAVYNLLTKKGLDAQHADLDGRDYGSFSRGGMSHDFSLKSAYTHIADEMPFTNYTPIFKDVLDHIWYSNNSLRVTGMLGQIDPEYLKRVPGFPNFHFPSDHIALVAEFRVEKKRNPQQKVEADFGPSSSRK